MQANYTDHFIINRDCQLLRRSVEAKNPSGIVGRVGQRCRLAFDGGRYSFNRDFSVAFKCLKAAVWTQQEKTLAEATDGLRLRLLQFPREYLQKWQKTGVEGTTLLEAVQDYGISTEEFDRAVEREALSELDALAIKLKLHEAGEGSGNKHREIVALYHLVQKREFEGVHVSLPVGMKGERTVALLQSRAPCLMEEWEKLKELYQTSDDRSVRFLEREDVAASFERLEQEVAKAFDAPAEEFFTEDERRWLEAVKATNSYLMVRSSGSEDGAYANAGGNSSSSYVPSTPEAVMEELKNVVISCFSRQSFKNRLLGGDSPFEKLPEVGATLQRLIGERIGGQRTEKRSPSH